MNKLSLIDIYGPGSFGCVSYSQGRSHPCLMQFLISFGYMKWHCKWCRM